MEESLRAALEQALALNPITGKYEYGLDVSRPYDTSPGSEYARRDTYLNSSGYGRFFKAMSASAAKDAVEAYNKKAEELKKQAEEAKAKNLPAPTEQLPPIESIPVPILVPLRKGPRELHAYQDRAEYTLLKGDTNSVRGYTLLRLDHPNIPKITPIYRESRIDYLFSEIPNRQPTGYYSMCTLDKFLNTRATDEERSLLQRQATDALSFVHSQGFYLGGVNNIYVVYFTSTLTEEEKKEGKQSQSPPPRIYLFPGLQTYRLRPKETISVGTGGLTGGIALVSQEDEMRALLTLLKIDSFDAKISAYAYPPEYPLNPNLLRDTVPVSGLTLDQWAAAIKDIGITGGFVYLEMLMSILMGDVPTAGRLGAHPGLRNGQIRTALSEVFASSTNAGNRPYLRAPLDFVLPNEDAMSKLWRYFTTVQNGLSAYAGYDNLRALTQLPTRMMTNGRPHDNAFVAIQVNPSEFPSPDAFVRPNIPSAEIKSFAGDTFVPPVVRDPKVHGITFNNTALQLLFRGSLLANAIPATYPDQPTTAPSTAAGDVKTEVKGLEAKLTPVKQETKTKPPRVAIRPDFIGVDDLALLHQFIDGSIPPAQLYRELTDQGFRALYGPNYLGIYHSDLEARNWLDLSHIAGLPVIEALADYKGMASNKPLIQWMIQSAASAIPPPLPAKTGSPGYIGLGTPPKVGETVSLVPSGTYVPAAGEVGVAQDTSYLRDLVERANRIGAGDLNDTDASLIESAQRQLAQGNIPSPIYTKMVSDLLRIVSTHRV